MPKLFLFVLLPLVGCTAGASLPPLASDNPASPAAAEAPPPAIPQTLSLSGEKATPSAPTSERGADKDMPSGHGGGHAHH